MVVIVRSGGPGFASAYRFRVVKPEMGSITTISRLLARRGVSWRLITTIARLESHVRWQIREAGPSVDSHPAVGVCDLIAGAFAYRSTATTSTPRRCNSIATSLPSSPAQSCRTRVAVGDRGDFVGDLVRRREGRVPFASTAHPHRAQPGAAAATDVRLDRVTDHPPPTVHRGEQRGPPQKRRGTVDQRVVQVEHCAGHGSTLAATSVTYGPVDPLPSVVRRTGSEELAYRRLLLGEDAEAGDLEGVCLGYSLVRTVHHVPDDV